MKNLVLIVLFFLVTGCGSSSSNKDEKAQSDITSNPNPTSTNNREEKDTTPPVITLNGDKSMVLVEGSSYTELGATALDAIDGELEVKISGVINTAEVGKYTITYYATDKSANEAHVERVIEIVSSPLNDENTLEGNSSTNQENNLTILDLNITTQENNVSLEELNITSCPTPPPAPRYPAPKNYYLLSLFKSSKIFSNVELISGKLSMTIEDIPANKRGVSFARVYNSYDNVGKSIGTFQTNYDGGIDKEIVKPIKSHYYFTAKDACERGWKDISLTKELKKNSDMTVVYDDETTLCNIYTKGENNESQLRVSFLTKDIRNKREKKAHTLTRPNGESYIFYKQDMHWLTVGNAPFKIEKVNGNFIVTDANGTVEEYNYYGNLVSLRKNNSIVELFYDEKSRLVEIKDAFNQKIILDYNKDALVGQVKSYDGTVITYEYNDKKQLVKVNYPDKSSKSYSYEGNQLKSILNASEVVTKTFFYDSKGRVNKILGMNDCHKLEFGYVDMETKVTQGTEQNSYIFKLLNSKFLPISITTDEGSSTIEYDSYGYPLFIGDDLGNITKILYNRNGLLIEKRVHFDTEDEIVTQISYDDLFFGKPRVVKQGDISTFYLYSDYGELLQEKIKAKGIPERVTIYGYDYRSHKVLTVKPNGGIVSYEYDIHGDNNSTIDILGFTSEFNPFDSAGRALGSSDINEINSTISYDIMGRILSLTEDNQTTTYLYDMEGREIARAYPTGLIVKRSYDEYGNILTVENNKGEKRVNLYSACGDTLLKREIFKDEVLIGQEEMEYDDKNRVVLKRDALGGETLYTYTQKGKISTVTDALNRVTSYEYDNYSNLIKEIDADGNTTTYSYNKNGQRVETYFPDGTALKISYDVLGRVIKKDGVRYQYDLSDNIISKKDTNGDTTTYTYDIANRKLTETHTNSSFDKSYEYDQGENANGKLTKIINSRGEIEFKYDIHGNLISKVEMIDDNNFTTEFTYDEKKRLKSKKYPDGKLVEYSYIKDEIVKITVNHRTFIKNIKRDQNGIVSYTYADGKMHQKEYDLKGQVTKIVYPNYTKSILYNAVGEIVDVTIEGEEYTLTQEEEELYSL